MFDLASVARRSALCGLLLSLPMCASDGTETDNPLIDFDASSCKGGHGLTLDPKVARTQAALDVPAQDFHNLFCYAWQVNDSGTVTIDVINRGGGCGVEWSPTETVVDGDHVELGIENASCIVAACGSCRYDLSFEIAGVTLDAPVQVRIVEAGCNGEPDDESSPVELPIDREPQGAMCRQLGMGFTPECSGLRERPCMPDDRFDQPFGTCSEGRCDEGLTCVEAAFQEQDLCFTACEADDDCPLAVESCEDGACRLRETL